MKNIRTLVASLLFVAVSAFVLLPVPSVGAASALDAVCADNADSAVCQDKDKTTPDFVGNLINTLLFVVGAISVIVIIIGGILYVTSNGDSSSVAKAKNTILYAIVGLIVAFIAYAIVNWVLVLFK